MALCLRQEALLNELMEFLKYSYLKPRLFHDVICFRFRDFNGNHACIRTIDMNREDDIVISDKEPSQYILNRVTDVAVSISDFLYMYSGQATAAEIAGMCMSGRVEVKWSGYGQVKAFADSFDFSSEKWNSYYETSKVVPVEEQDMKCNCTCCGTSVSEKIDTNWQIVFESISRNMGEWEWVEDSEVYSTNTKDSPKIQPNDVGVWPFNPDLDSPQIVQVRETVKRKMLTIREYASRFLFNESGW